MATVAALPPRTYAQVSVDAVDIPYIVNNRKLKLDEVKNLIQGLLNEALETTITETEIWCDQHVPKRSGDLMASIKKFLKRSIPPPAAQGEFRGTRLILGVGVEIDYAKYVNQMTKSRVRHVSTWFEHSGKKAYSKGKPVFLDDPRAEGFFFDKLVEFATERFETNLAKSKYEYNSQLGSRNLSKLQVS